MDGWVPVTRELLDDNPAWLDNCWIAYGGSVLAARYVWRQGRNPDTFITTHVDHRQEIWAFLPTHVMPMKVPNLPKL